MRNERGLTLMEVLGSLTLLVVVMGVAFMLFSSVNQLFNQTSQDYINKTHLRTTMNTISSRMADAVAVRLENANQLRFRTFAGADRNWAIVYEESTSSITLYKLDNPTADLSGGTLSRIQILAENVEGYSVRTDDGTGKVNLGVGTLVTDGSKIHIRVEFAITRIGANSQRIVMPLKIMEVVIPLSVDSI
jgi:hypothetical protein